MFNHTRWRAGFLATAILAGALGLAPHSALPPDPAGEPFQLPPGFVIEKVAAPPLVEHPMMACFDERGRLFIAESAGQNLPAKELIKAPPNFIRVLDPADESGRFHKGHVFADKLTFPMGVLWHEGALYTCSSGALWKLEDTKKTGVADKRTELVKKFGFTGNAADVHGPFLAPDGRLYWCEGRHGHEIERPDGTVLKGKAARIFRCRPDGSEIEVVCGGGMDNPVEIAFTPEGEPFATINILHARPARHDGIIYAIEGGVWPWHDVYKEFPQTGELLPAAADLGWVAPSGLMRYRSESLGKEYRNNLFSAQFNRSRIQRHIVERDGAGFKIKSEDFLVSNDKDFHPTDVLEDADGSLLVIDTGGWFRIGCPTSQIAKPEVKGAIYRIRKKDAKPVKDPRGLEIPWEKLDLELSFSLLFWGKDRFAVETRAVQEYAKRGQAGVKFLREGLSALTDDETVSAIWALTRVDLPDARMLVRTLLSHRSATVRLAALHSVGLHRDGGALEELCRLVHTDNEPAVRRSAAMALGRIGKAEAIPVLMEAMPKAAGDRFLEHALIYALIQINDRDKTAKYLADQPTAVRRAALIALDQMPSGKLIAEEVMPLLVSDDAALQKATFAVIADRPDWGPVVGDLLRGWLAKSQLDAARRESIRGLLIGLAKDKGIQEIVTQGLESFTTPRATRVLLLETMAAAPLAKLPAAWVRQLGQALCHVDAPVVQQAVATLRAANVTEFDSALLNLACDNARGVELRSSRLEECRGRVVS